MRERKREGGREREREEGGREIERERGQGPSLYIHVYIVLYKIVPVRLI